MCDVFVVGAGPAGAACALALERRGVHAILLDATSGRRPSPGESLHGVARTSLTQLGLWPEFLEQRFQRSYLAEIAWQTTAPRERHAIDHVWGPEFHLERGAFDAWLVAAAVRGGSEHVHCVALDDVVFDRSAQRFRCSVLTEFGMTTIESNGLVDATGRSAAVMRRLGGRIVTDRDRLIAVATTYVDPLPHPSVLIEAAADGWWYSAPLPGDRSVAVWFTDAELARGRALRPEYFVAALRASVHTCARVIDLRSDGLLSVCAAGPTYAVFDSSLPALPVGDAATAFDPISGDGLCFALRSALDAAETFMQYRSGRRDAVPAYADGARAVFSRHITRRALLYEAVTRFGDAPFWNQRRGVVWPSLPPNLAIGSGAMAVTRTMGARSFRSESWRRSDHH
jgi:flavin-dependent dehydrogenase